MSPLSDKSKRPLIWAAALIFLVMFLFTLISPLMAEDFMYFFSFADGRPIDSLSSVIRSMAAHRYSMNGRVLAHALTHIFLALPRIVFSFFNAMNALVLLLIVYGFVNSRDGKCPVHLMLCFVFMSWLFIPVYGQVFFWLVGSLNYSWALCFTLGFLCPFYRLYFCGRAFGLEKKGFFVRKLLFLLLAFAAGAYSENGSCAMLLMCALFMLLIKRERKPLPAIFPIGFAAAGLGFVFLMSAPAELGGRTAEFSAAVIASNISWIIQSAKENLLLPLCIFAALIAIAASFKSAEYRELAAALVLLVGAAVSVGVFALAAYFPRRSLCFAVTYIIIACLILIRNLYDSRQTQRLLAVAVSVLFTVFLFDFCLGAMDIAGVYLEAREREQIITAAVAKGEDSVELPRYDVNTKYSAAYLTGDVSGDKDETYNTWMADYYGLSEIVGVAAKGSQ